MILRYNSSKNAYNIQVLFKSNGVFNIFSLFDPLWASPDPAKDLFVSQASTIE